MITAYDICAVKKSTVSDIYSISRGRATGSRTTINIYGIRKSTPVNVYCVIIGNSRKATARNRFDRKLTPVNVYCVIIVISRTATAHNRCGNKSVFSIIDSNCIIAGGGTISARKLFDFIMTVVDNDSIAIGFR